MGHRVEQQRGQREPHDEAVQFGSGRGAEQIAAAAEKAREDQREDRQQDFERRQHEVAATKVKRTETRKGKRLHLYNPMPIQTLDDTFFASCSTSSRFATSSRSPKRAISGARPRG
jgi:hypothetical protein